MEVPPYLLVERFGSDAVEIRQISVEHDSLPPDRKDAALDRVLARELHVLDSRCLACQRWSQSVTTYSELIGTRRAAIVTVRNAGTA